MSAFTLAFPDNPPSPPCLLTPVTKQLIYYLSLTLSLSPPQTILNKDPQRLKSLFHQCIPKASNSASYVLATQ